LALAKLGFWVNLSGFANVPNAGWKRIFKKCEVGAIEILSFSVE